MWRRLASHMLPPPHAPSCSPAPLTPCAPAGNCYFGVKATNAQAAGAVAALIFDASLGGYFVVAADSSTGSEVSAGRHGVVAARWVPLRAVGASAHSKATRLLLADEAGTSRDPGAPAAPGR